MTAWSPSQVLFVCDLVVTPSSNGGEPRPHGRKESPCCRASCLLPDPPLAPGSTQLKDQNGLGAPSLGTSCWDTRDFSSLHLLPPAPDRSAYVSADVTKEATF